MVPWLREAHYWRPRLRLGLPTSLGEAEPLLHYHIFHMHLEAMFTEPYRHTSSSASAVKLTLTTNCTHRLTDAARDQIHTDTFTRYILFSFRLFSIFVSILAVLYVFRGRPKRYKGVRKWFCKYSLRPRPSSPPACLISRL